MFILITASLSSKMYNKSFLTRRIDVWGNTVNIIQKHWTFLEIAGRAHDLRRGKQQVFPFLHGSETCFQEFESKQPVYSQSNIQRNKWFLIVLNCVKLKSVSCTSNSSEQMYDFQKRTIFSQKWILNPQDLPQNQKIKTVPVCIVLAVLPTWQYCLYSHLKRNQSIHAFVTCFGPFCDGSCKFIHWPYNIKSSNPCQVSAFENNWRTCLWQFSNRFCFFFFEVVVIDAWSRYFVELLNLLVSQLAISFHTFLGMAFHVIRPWRNTKISREW